MQYQKITEKSRKRILTWLPFILLAVSFIMLFFPYYILNGIGSRRYHVVIPEYNKLATFISGVTAPFLSLAAFILLYRTYKAQRLELADSKLMLKDQLSTMQKQRFETTFFSLLTLHNSIVNSIDLTVKPIQYVLGDRSSTPNEKKYGRDCFVTFYQGLKIAYHGEKKSHNENEDELEIVKNAYFHFFSKHEYDLAHYFRTLYHLIKFIDQSEIQDKQRYVSLVRAQLSSHELLLLFYNCLSVVGTKFKPYMAKYHFLKNMNTDLLLDKSHEIFYDSSAYGSN